MYALFLFLAFLSLSDCEASSHSSSLRRSASPAPYYSPPAVSPIAERTADLSSSDNGFVLSDKRDVGTIVHSSTPMPSSRPSTFASSPSNRSDSFKLYFTLYLSPASSKMDVATTTTFQNSTLAFVTENVPTFPGVAVDVNSIVVIGQLLVKQEETKIDDGVLQIDAFASGSIAMNFHVTNLTRVAVRNSIALALFSHGASSPMAQSHLSYLHAASVFFESIDQITTSHQNDNDLLVLSTEANEIGISKPAVLATAGTLTLFLIVILGGFMSFRRYRKRALRQKKISSNNAAPDPTDSFDESCRERPPVQHIASDDLASVTSSVSGTSEILCGTSTFRYSKGEISGARVITGRYPIQERRTNGTKQQHSTQEKRSDQVSNVSVLSDLVFDTCSWSVFSATCVCPVQTREDMAANEPTASDNDDDLVRTFVVESLGQDDDEIPQCTGNLSRKVKEMPDITHLDTSETI